MKFKGKTRRIKEQIKGVQMTMEKVTKLFPWMDRQERECLYRIQFCGKAAAIVLNSGIKVYPVAARGMLVYPRKELLRVERLHKLNASQKKEFWGCLNGCTCIAEGMYWHDVLNAFEWATKKRPYAWD